MNTEPETHDAESHLISADPALCTTCGICVEVCPQRIIILDGELPRIEGAEDCIVCGHCVAVCPQAALDHVRAPLAAQEPLDRFPVLDAATATLFLRSRRSIRAYKPDPVPPEQMLRLLEIARFAPSGSNSQGLSYVVVTDAEVRGRIIALVNEWLADQVAAGAAWTKRFARMAVLYKTTGADLILRGAPCLVVATAPRAFPPGYESARYALEYVELLAPSLGLGACWAGWVEHYGMEDGSPLPALLGLSEDMTIAGALMVGFPRYTYQRLVDRDPLQVSWL